MRGANERAAFFGAVADYLRAQRHPWPSSPATFCGRCGRRIDAGTGHVDLALRYYTRRCGRRGERNDP